jgi:hypothetical protein
MIDAAREDASRAAKDAGLSGDAATKFVAEAVAHAAQAAADLNSEQIPPPPSPPLLAWVFGICGIVVLVAVLVFLILIFMMMRSQLKGQAGYARVDTVGQQANDVKD